MEYDVVMHKSILLNQGVLTVQPYWFRIWCGDAKSIFLNQGVEELCYGLLLLFIGIAHNAPGVLKNVSGYGYMRS